MKKIILIGLGVFFGLAIIGQFLPKQAATTTPTSARQAPARQAPASVAQAKPKAATPESDAESGLACTHFHNVMSDVLKGILTDSELRGKIKEIYDESGIATAPIQDAATDLLAAATSSNSDAFLSAVGKMDGACSATGN